MEITKTSKDGFFINSKALNLAINSNEAKADVLLFSSKNTEKPKNADARVFDSAGEYEVKKCMIDATQLDENETGFTVLIDGVQLAFLGSGIEEVLTDKQVEVFAAVDVLILPIIGEKAEITSKIISQIEPTTVIPHSYSNDTIAMFGKEFGSDTEKTSKIKINKKDLNESDKQKLVIL